MEKEKMPGSLIILQPSCNFTKNVVYICWFFGKGIDLP